MKAIIISAALVLAFGTSQAQDNYKVNAGKSNIEWHAEKVTGSHDGNVKVKGGELAMTDGKLTGGSFVMDMTSITCTDLDDPEWNGKLVGHLKSDDFFSVEKNPEAKMEITKVVHEGKNRYKVMGNLTIKGITNEVQFTAFVDEADGIVTGNADITIDRTKFDIRYGSGSFFDDLGDKTIYDEFNVKVNLVTNKGGKA